MLLYIVNKEIIREAHGPPHQSRLLSGQGPRKKGLTIHLRPGNHKIAPDDNPKLLFLKQLLKLYG